MTHENTLIGGHHLGILAACRWCVLSEIFQFTLKFNTMIQEVKFKKETSSKGRNGIIKTSGVEVMSSGYGVMISPITSKGRPSDACFIEVDKNCMGDTILAMMKASNTDPLIGLHEDIFQLSMMYGHWSATNDPETVFTGGSGQAMGDIIQWAKEFNAMNANREWDGEWYEELEAFFNQKMKSA